ncbi:hypothetical protein [Flavobacterium cerinum]|uniref:Outer membrane protein assembly factor BamE n=1 Tax=Flavobacterium cerinum TaxID=2502784 RepID=A0ABY5ISC9_9FLAO|nr:hypothetical protein [Flavobacterium cerinum]UUC45700.1 hypothetical protein NOX80_00470 [Flavobacterium cerinum]
MKKQIVAALLLIVCFACKQESDNSEKKSDVKTEQHMAFDKVKWGVKNDAAYAYRDKMLYDLIENRKVRQLKKEEIVALLGEPDRTDSLFLFYTILQKRMFLFPLHTKSMVIKLKENDSVEWIKMHE